MIAREKAVYFALLQLSLSSPLRLQAQGLMASLVDYIARAERRDPEEVQTSFEAIANPHNPYI